MVYMEKMCLFVGEIPVEIEIKEFQTQFCFTSNTHLVKNMLKIRFDRADGDSHRKGDLLVLIPDAGKKGNILLARGKIQPAVIEINEIPVTRSASSQSICRSVL